MAPSKRDDFSEATRRKLAIRAAYFCCNPDCLKLTAGPHSNVEKALATGHAAHIHAAAVKGPRYDPQQTPAQRRSMENGLWLCRECGVLVDGDTSKHTAAHLRQWKAEHEVLINEVRQKGYSRSLDLLQTRQREPAVARHLVATFEDRRALYVRFDAEFPDRVRHSLDMLRADITKLRGELAQGSLLNALMFAMTKTIHAFFNRVEILDLATLRCDSTDPRWRNFEDALKVLRKSILYQLASVAERHGLALSDELRRGIPHVV